MAVGVWAAGGGGRVGGQWACGWAVGVWVGGACVCGLRVCVWAVRTVTKETVRNS